ncbi:MAG: prepilin-type N-terminal cleavage/methylation domain-containing protein [Planctomycetota bacterium]|nr:MAG: prepilin-type N-terminal cleavage/methylation domain-containing protein [Planctomycetota bacterium]
MNTFAITRRARRGFTLVELIAVMVVLAVLAGVAIPKYFDYADRARTAALSGALGGIRTGLANFYTNSSFNGTAAYPTFAQLTTQGTVMQEAIPENPYNGLNNVVEITVLLDAQNRVVANPTTVGWNYYVDNTANPPVAIFWANSTDNTTATDSAGNPIPANQM